MSLALRQLIETDVLAASPALLGAVLIHGERWAQVVEVEAYRGDEAGCHAYRSRTPRNEAMFGPPGIAYVYFTYGNHWMLNLVCHAPDHAAAILIRAAKPLAGLDTMRAARPKAAKDRDLLSGPGKLCQAFGIDGRLNTLDLLDPHSELRIELPTRTVERVLVGTRIGLAPGKGDELPWRFVDGNEAEWASRPLPR